MGRDVIIEEMSVKNGRIDIRATHPVFAVFLQELVQLWHQNNAENYLELNCWTKATGPINIMIQRTEGKSTAQVNMELKYRLAELEEKYRVVCRVAYGEIPEDLGEAPDNGKD